ncbi:adenylate kinase [uncultured Alistipes sp.]|jgi:adenylate kinase|uniref:adenylate kinase n=1 Tax=uncultured Alistipes sp. TaxID=538949 RepID=UPI0025FFD82A|nr:adenylate kinase [uncultured Alistipes sp.]
MVNIVLFGAPGCGKGTQAQRLKEHYGITHVSTGEVIRDEIARGTELGREMESYIKEGRLAPDHIVIDMVAGFIDEHRHTKGCIFDGFPRTTRQAEEFETMLAEHGLQVDAMVDIRVPEEELVRRILLRGKDSGRADDASEEVIRNRIEVYRRQTEVVADFYAQRGKYADVDGVGSMDEVFDRIRTIIDDRIGGDR